MLSDNDVLSIYGKLQESNHPDPVGFLARSEVLSDLDSNFSSDKNFGVTGVRQEDVDRIGIPQAGEINDNVAAAIAVDLDNYANFKDVGDTHVAFVGGGEAVKDRSKRPKKFMRELGKAKVKWDKRLKDLVDKKAEPAEDVVVDQIVPPEFNGNVPTPQSLAPVQGDGNRIAQIRQNAQNASPPKQRAIPKSRVDKSKKALRSLIREALRSA